MKDELLNKIIESEKETVGLFIYPSYEATANKRIYKKLYKSYENLDFEKLIQQIDESTIDKINQIGLVNVVTAEELEKALRERK